MAKIKLLLALVITVVGVVSTFAEIKTYRVVPGDTLWSIARESGVPLDALLGLNGISIEDPNWDRINAGDVLLVKHDYWYSNSLVKLIDSIIRGDAKEAARHIHYPFQANFLRPDVPEIKTEEEFVRFFHVLFDAELREELKRQRRKTGGWCSKNGQGDMFGMGELWAWEGKLIGMNAVSVPAFKMWQTAYRRSLDTLASEYRTNCVWAACYFMSDNKEYFGRIDSLGDPWVRGAGVGQTEVGVKVSDKFRILLFKRHQKTSDTPWRIFYYDAKEDPLFAGASWEGFASSRNDFNFFLSKTKQIPAEMVLIFDSKKDKRTLYLNACEWPPPNAAREGKQKPEEEGDRAHTRLSFFDDKIKFVGTPYDAVPENAKLLFESGKFALFSGETAEDSAHNTTDGSPRNSLFLRRRTTDGKTEWRLILTSGSDWKEADGMSEWCFCQSSDLKKNFYVLSAKFGLDRRRLWLVCDTGIPVWKVICSYDVQTDEFRALIDGNSVEEQPDGTILVKGKKTYLSDKNGEPLGARWYDAWITPDGKIVRKGKLEKLEGQ